MEESKLGKEVEVGHVWLMYPRKQRDLLFLHGKLKKGKWEYFTHDILDFQETALGEGVTVGKIYTALKMGTVRFYLSMDEVPGQSMPNSNSETQNTDLSLRGKGTLSKEKGNKESHVIQKRADVHAHFSSSERPEEINISVLTEEDILVGYIDIYSKDSSGMIPVQVLIENTTAGEQSMSAPPNNLTQEYSVTSLEEINQSLVSEIQFGPLLGDPQPSQLADHLKNLTNF